MTRDEITAVLASWPQDLHRSVDVEPFSEEMAQHPTVWWKAILALIESATLAADVGAIGRGPLAMLLSEAPDLQESISDAARADPKVATAFFSAMEREPERFYDALGGEAVAQSWLRGREESDAISRQNVSHAEQLRGQQMNSWPWLLFTEWAIAPSEGLWPAVLNLLKRVPSEELSFVGVSVLEDLLQDHPREYVPKVEFEARNNRRLADAVCIYHVAPGFEERVWAAVGRRPDARSDRPHR